MNYLENGLRINGLVPQKQEKEQIKGQSRAMTETYKQAILGKLDERSILLTGQELWNAFRMGNFLLDPTTVKSNHIRRFLNWSNNVLSDADVVGYELFKRYMLKGHVPEGKEELAQQAYQDLIGGRINANSR